MGTTMWKGLLILAGATLLVVTTGTAVVAMINDDDEGMGVFADERPSDQQGGAVAAMCVPEFPDCQDTFVEGADGEFEQCATAEPCGDFDAKCAANTACMEPGMLEALYCDPGATIDACYPGGLPTGYDCETRESFPVQVVCYPFDCVPYDDGGVTILPAPAPYDEPIEEPQPRIDVGEPSPGTVTAVRCLPPDCAISSDGAIDCPLPEPCSISSAPDARCLPPDCAISSYGAIHCPLPEPCTPIDDTGVTAPDPAVCEPVEPPSGGGSSGGSEGSPGAEATVVPVEPQ